MRTVLAFADIVCPKKTKTKTKEKQKQTNKTTNKTKKEVTGNIISQQQNFSLHQTVQRLLIY